MQKKELRALYLKKRSELEPGTIEIKSRLIGEAIVRWLLQEKKIKTLHTFLPAEGKNEIDTFLILDLIAKELSLKFFVPRVSPKSRELTHHHYSPGQQLIKSRWGIPEPEESNPISPSEADVVLVPMLIFDKSGHRVGYGGGFYDTFLARCRPDTLRIGLCLFEPVDSIEDTQSYDIRMNICITPGRTWVFD